MVARYRRSAIPVDGPALPAGKCSLTSGCAPSAPGLVAVTGDDDHDDHEHVALVLVSTLQGMVMEGVIVENDPNPSQS